MLQYGQEWEEGPESGGEGHQVPCISPGIQLERILERFKEEES